MRRHPVSCSRPCTDCRNRPTPRAHQLARAAPGPLPATLLCQSMRDALGDFDGGVVLGEQLHEGGVMRERRHVVARLVHARHELEILRAARSAWGRSAVVHSAATAERSARTFAFANTLLRRTFSISPLGVETAAPSIASSLCGTRNPCSGCRSGAIGMEPSRWRFAAISLERCAIRRCAPAAAEPDEGVVTHRALRGTAQSSAHGRRCRTGVGMATQNLVGCGWGS